MSILCVCVCVCVCMCERKGKTEIFQPGKGKGIHIYRKKHDITGKIYMPINELMI